MHRFQIQWLGLLVCLVTLIGCGDDVDPLADLDDAAKDAQKSEADAKSDGKNDDQVALSRPNIKIPERQKRKVRKAIQRDSLTGRWFVQLMHVLENPNPQEGQPPLQFGERPILLISTVPGDGGDNKGTVTIVASRDEFLDLKIANAVVTDNTINFECVDSNGEKVSDYNGELRDTGVALGVSLLAGNATPARLLPTLEKTFARTPRFVFLEEQADMMRLGSSPVPEEDLLQFAKNNPDSPLPRMGYRFLIQNFAANNKSTRIMDRVIADYVKTQSRWGKRLEKLAQVESLQLMSASQYNPEYCLKMADEVESILDGTEGVETLPQQLKDLRTSLNYLLAITQIESEKEDEKKAGRERLRKLLADAPFDPNLVVNLADDARLSDRQDEAINLYAQLVVLPLQEQFLEEKWSQLPVKKLLPSERLAKLWKGNTTGFDDIDKYLAKVYADNIHSFADKPIEARPNADGNKVVLCESFPSSDNPYSIASTVALGGIRKTYNGSMVVVLRYYQQHNTSIGPVVNEESEVRCFNYYQINGSPGLMIDGVVQNGIAGPLAATPAVYKTIQETINKNLAKKTEVAIKLTADRTGDELRVTANATGADASNKSLRLRIVLAESSIEFKSFNGIRQNNMVVRKLIGGDSGIAATSDGFKYEGTTDLKAVRSELDAYLKRFEENYSKKLADKPLDLKDLHVVAFVQDDSTKEVVQTIVIPVTTAK
jgi:hypothetical protein